MALINRPPSAYLGWKAGAHALEQFWAVFKYAKDKLPDGSQAQANLPILHCNIQTAPWNLSSAHQEFTRDQRRIAGHGLIASVIFNSLCCWFFLVS